MLFMSEYNIDKSYITVKFSFHKKKNPGNHGPAHWHVTYDMERK